jgi:hypothetical protein
MISSAKVARIKAEIRMLEQARRSCNDSGIRDQIDVFLEAHNSELKQLTAQKPSHLHDERSKGVPKPARRA